MPPSIRRLYAGRGVLGDDIPRRSFTRGRPGRVVCVDRRTLGARETAPPEQRCPTAVKRENAGMCARTGAFTLEYAVAWLDRLTVAFEENSEYLTRLDAAIGDGDHGINMERGFTAVRQKQTAASPADLGALLKLAGSTLISTVGGASGPLYG